MGTGLFGLVMSTADSQSAFTAENWRILRSFNFYRLGIAIAAVALAYSGETIPPFGTTSPALFSIASLVYTGIALLSVIAIYRRWPDFETQATFLAFVDIVLLTLLMHASQGLESGVGLLLLVAVAGASLTLGTRLTILFAALATIAIGIEVNWAFLTEGELVANGGQRMVTRKWACLESVCLPPPPSPSCSPNDCAPPRLWPSNAAWTWPICRRLMNLSSRACIRVSWPATRMAGCTC